MAEITDLTGMKNYVLTELGYPVTNVEIAESQLEQVIENSVNDFRRYNANEGMYRDYFLLQTAAGQQDYYVSAVTDYTTSATLDNVDSVYDFHVSVGIGGINTLFSPAHILLYNEYVNAGGYPGGPWGGGTGLVLANYQAAMMYLDLIERMFSKQYTVDYLPGRKVLRVVPTPDEAFIGVLEILRKEYAYNLYNNMLVKRLAVARALIMQGRNLNKYSGSLPGGLTINSQALIDEGKAEEEKWLERMWEESEQPDFHIM